MTKSTTVDLSLDPVLEALVKATGLGKFYISKSAVNRLVK